jgi:hypothetical protein
MISHLTIADRDQKSLIVAGYSFTAGGCVVKCDEVPVWSSHSGQDRETEETLDQINIP